MTAKTAPAPLPGGGDLSAKSPSSSDRHGSLLSQYKNLTIALSQHDAPQDLGMVDHDTPQDIAMVEDGATVLKPGVFPEEETWVRRRRRAIIVLLVLCFASLLSIIVGLSVVVARERRSSRTIAPAGAKANPDMISQSYVQIYGGADVAAMDRAQIAAYERVLSGYSVYYYAEEGAGAVSVQCVLNLQRLDLSSQLRKRKHGRSDHPITDGGDGPERRLDGSDGRGGELAAALEVDFSMTWSSSPLSSSSTDLTVFPADFLKYMNSPLGKERTVLDMRSLLGIAAMSASNVTLRGGVQSNIFVITDAPTAAPTDAPTSAPTDAPTSAPTRGPSLHPTVAPTPAPSTAEPTDVPASQPTTDTSHQHCCWIDMFDWCLIHMHC